jgi:site-specific DNA recombinase
MAGLLWGIYVRTSDDSREGAGLGVKRQEKDVRAMIPRIDPEGAVVEVYVDNDLSAYSGKPRKEYVRMCGDVITGRITAIGAWHSDRLHRPDLRELEDFIDLIEGNKTL